MISLNSLSLPKHFDAFQKNKFNLMPFDVKGFLGGKSGQNKVILLLELS